MKTSSRVGSITTGSTRHGSRGVMRPRRLPASYATTTTAKSVGGLSHYQRTPELAPAGLVGVECGSAVSATSGSSPTTVSDAPSNRVVKRTVIDNLPAAARLTALAVTPHAAAAEQRS